MFSRKLSPPVVNGCNLVTSVMSSVLGHSGNCRSCGLLNIGSIRIYILMTGWLEVVSNETN